MNSPTKQKKQKEKGPKKKRRLFFQKTPKEESKKKKFLKKEVKKSQADWSKLCSLRPRKQDAAVSSSYRLSRIIHKNITEQNGNNDFIKDKTKKQTPQEKLCT